jgi:hypothetical protein
VNGNRQIPKQGQGRQRIVQPICIVSIPDTPVLPPPWHSPETEKDSLFRQLATPFRLSFPQLFFSLIAALYAGDFHVHQKVHHDLFGTPVFLSLDRE